MKKIRFLVNGKKTLLVEKIGEVQKLYRRGTKLCMLDPDDNFIRIWGGYSATTMRYINDFRTLNGLEKLTKKEWLEMNIG